MGGSSQNVTWGKKDKNIWTKIKAQKFANESQNYWLTRTISFVREKLQIQEDCAKSSKLLFMDIWEMKIGL